MGLLYVAGLIVENQDAGHYQLATLNENIAIARRYEMK
jgi:hypothetical protein